MTDHRLKSVPHMTPTLITTLAKSIEVVLASPSVQAAFHFFDSHAGDITEEQIKICTIPAPPFGEKRRAEYLCARLGELGLEDVQIDEKEMRGKRVSSLSPLRSLARTRTVFPPGLTSLFARAAAGVRPVYGPAVAGALRDRSVWKLPGSRLRVLSLVVRGRGRCGKSAGLWGYLLSRRWASRVDALYASMAAD